MTRSLPHRHLPTRLVSSRFRPSRRLHNQRGPDATPTPIRLLERWRRSHVRCPYTPYLTYWPSQQPPAGTAFFWCQGGCSSALSTQLAHLSAALSKASLVTPQTAQILRTARRRGGRILKWPVCTCKRRVRRLLCSRIAGSTRLAHLAQGPKDRELRQDKTLVRCFDTTTHH